MHDLTFFIEGTSYIISNITSSITALKALAPVFLLIAKSTIVFKALKEDSFWGWIKFSAWYKKWRKNISITH